MPLEPPTWDPAPAHVILPAGEWQDFSPAELQHPQYVSITSSSNVTITLPPGQWSTVSTATTFDPGSFTGGWYTYTWPPPGPPPVRDPVEEIEAAVRRVDEQAAREVARGAREIQRTIATERAAQLLLSVLDEEQAASYRRDRTFEVVGSHGGRYRINPGAMGNVDALDPATGEVLGQLCAHPVLWDGHGSLPDPDVALAQMLHLTTDEPGWVRTANVHRGRRPQVAALAA